MISICLTCANNKAGRCAALNTDIIDIIDYFVCDFYGEKRTGAYRRKKAKVNRGNDVTFIIGKRGAGKEYVMKKIIMEGRNDIYTDVCESIQAGQYTMQDMRSIHIRT